MIDIELVYGTGPRAVDRVVLSLPEGTTVAQALRESGLAERHGLMLDEQLSVGIWGRPSRLDAVLRQADRVELYRPLQVDPKEARRQRYRRQKTDKRTARLAAKPSAG